MVHTIHRSTAAAALLVLGFAFPTLAQPVAKQGLQSADIYRLRSVGDVQISPDGRTIVYAVTNNDRPGRPYSQVWQMDVATRHQPTAGWRSRTPPASRTSPPTASAWPTSARSRRARA